LNDMSPLAAPRETSSQRGTFDMSPDIEGNIYYLIPKVNNYELRPTNLDF
jgi:hypothetical protein